MHEKQAETPAVEDQVRLPPVLGVRPGHYLAALYAIVILLILFFILMYPGLRRPGSVVELTTEPSGAALRVDGVYAGTAPDSIFVSRGKHTLELVLPGFAAERLEREIPGRLFASALFPRRYPLKVTLTAPDPAAAFARAAGDYAAWSFGGEPTAVWQIPLSLSEGAYRTGPALADGAEIARLLRASARFASTRAALRDLIRAKAIADNAGIPPSPASLFNSAADIIGFLAENPGSAAWLAGKLPPQSAALVNASAWYQKERAAAADIAADETLAPGPGAVPGRAPPPDRHLILGGLSFTGIPGGVLVSEEPFPHRVPIGGFMLCDTRITAAAWEAFLAGNQQWRDEQPGAAAGGVSWYAAAAFCEWLSARLPLSPAAWEVRLPTEAEWEYAVKSVKTWPAPGGIADLTGGVWEWCADPYAPLAFITADPGAVAAVGSPERSVRGGAGPETRGSLPPEFRSPFVSFRPVIAVKQ
jgi:hypothetical protein